MYYNKKTENKEKGGTSLCRRMEQHLGIGILMQDIAETFEEQKNRHLCNLKRNSNLSIKCFGKNWTYLKNLI